MFRGEHADTTRLNLQLFSSVSSVLVSVGYSAYVMTLPSRTVAVSSAKMAPGAYAAVIVVAARWDSLLDASALLAIWVTVAADTLQGAMIVLAVLLVGRETS